MGTSEKEFKRLIAEDLKRAFREIESQIHSTDFYYNDFMALFGRYKKNEHNFYQGLIENERYRLEVNIIRCGLLDWVDKRDGTGPFEENEKVPKRKTPAKARSLRKGIRGFLLVIVMLAVGTGIYMAASKFLFDPVKPYPQDNYLYRAVHDMLEQYYVVLSNKDFDQLRYYYPNQVDRYFDLTNISIDEIIRRQKKYKRMIEEEEVEVDWNTLKVVDDEQEIVVEYLMQYWKKKYHQRKRYFRIKMNLKLNQSLTIKSIREQILEKD